MLLSTALKFETSVFFGMPRDFKVSHSCFGFLIHSESLSSKNANFFAVINFNVLHFAFLYSSLSLRSLDFLKLLKSLSPVFIRSKTSPSNHFWGFALTLWSYKVHYCQQLSLFFVMEGHKFTLLQLTWCLILILCYLQTLEPNSW